MLDLTRKVRETVVSASILVMPGSSPDDLAMREVPASAALNGSGSGVTAFHVATLLALLRAGEQSAAGAFDRIARRLSAGELQLAAPRLTALIADEQRHDLALAAHCDLLPHVIVGDAMTRRFFRGLESREPSVHLARIAALDSCVCQVLTRVLARGRPRQWGESLMDLLSRIRFDEARHVHTTRDLVRMCGADTGLLLTVNAEVRHGFAALLDARAPAFEALGVDCSSLVAHIRREH
jgi:hypothetical protein